MRVSTMRGAALLAGALLVLAACDEAPPPSAAPVAATPPRTNPAHPMGIVLGPQQPEGTNPDGTPILVNDPSAAADTPLCGTAARETNTMGESLLPRRTAEAGICASYACYDPATATYIGADGYRHVCR